MLLFMCRFLLIFVIIYYYCRCKKKFYWYRRNVYVPSSHWLFGHFHPVQYYKKSPLIIFDEIYKKCRGKRIVGMYILFKPVLLLRDCKIIKQMFVKDFHVFSNRYFVPKCESDVTGRMNLFSIDTPAWNLLRKKLLPVFRLNSQMSMFELILPRVGNMMIYLCEKVSGEEKVTIDCKSVAIKYVTDVMSSLTLGMDINSFQNELPELYIRSRTLNSRDSYNTFRNFVNFFFPKLNDYLGLTYLRKHEFYFEMLFRTSIYNRQITKTDKGDFIDFLRKLITSEKLNYDFPFNITTLYAQAVMFFIDNLETNAKTMSFTLLELAKNPDIQQRVRNEITHKIGNEPLAYEHIVEMSYLKQVLCETLRLYPPTAILDRVANEDYHIPGTNVTIEKGTVVCVNLKGIHEDPRYHPDPLKYDPDRFSEARIQDIKPCTYMPFGTGPRTCIGKRTAEMQIMTGLIALLSEFEVSLNPDYADELTARAVFTSSSEEINLYLKRIPMFY